MEKHLIKNTKPYSVESEKSLLSCMLINEDIAYDIIGLINQDDFYINRHQIIFNAILLVIQDNSNLDIITLIDKLEKTGNTSKAGGIEYISEVANYAPSAANYRQYLKIVKRDSTLRKLCEASSNIAEYTNSSEDSEDAVSYAEKQIFDISERINMSKLVHVAPSGIAVLEKFEKLKRDPDAYKGIQTRYKRLDGLTQGLQRSDLIVIAARPACGKTAFAMNVATNIALNGGVVAVFSLEMSSVQLMQRMICSVADVEISKAVSGTMSDNDFIKTSEAMRSLNNTKLFIDESSRPTPQDIISRCRKLTREQGSLDLIVVDYLQLMGLKKRTDNRQQEISELTRELKIAAKELNTPILLLSQLSRAIELRKSTQDNEPQLSDLRESGAIEQDADIVMFLHNPVKIEKGQPNRLVSLIVAKHRNGSTANIEYLFKNDRVKFIELSNDEGKAMISEAREEEKIKFREEKERAKIQEPAQEESEVTAVNKKTANISSGLKSLSQAINSEQVDDGDVPF